MTFLKLHHPEAFHELVERYCEIVSTLYNEKLTMYIRDTFKLVHHRIGRRETLFASEVTKTEAIDAKTFYECWSASSGQVVLGPVGQQSLHRQIYLYDLQDRLEMFNEERKESEETEQQALFVEDPIVAYHSENRQ